jgi:serine/threonine protein kinase
LRPGDIIDERFRADARADEGGMGTIFKGTDLRTNAPVALKVLTLNSVADVERFQRESTLLADVSHPAIVRYIANGQLAEGERYLVMEWVEGETLAARLKSSGLDIVESVAAARRMAEALGAVHARGVVHRDLKPKNVILMDGQAASAKLIDFGIARHAEEVSSLTRTGVMVGTAGYMAPEQVRGQREIDGRLDLFALGCVLYECLTGKAPFTGQDPIATRAKVLITDPTPVFALNPDVSQELGTLVSRLLEKDPRRRPASAADVVQALDALHEQPGQRHIRGATRQLTTETRFIHKPASGEQPSLICMVLIGTTEEELGPEQMLDLQAERRERIEPVLPESGHLEVLDDGWSVVTLTGQGTVYDVTAQAARCALKIRQQIPDAPIAIAAQKTPDSSVDELIDRGAETAVRESLESIFASASRHPGSGAIRLDEVTVQLLPEQFEVVRSATGFYLMRERGEPL